MKKKGEVSTVNYDPEQVTENISVQFTKMVKGEQVTISGNIAKDGTDIGSVASDTQGDYLVLRLRPASQLTAEEREQTISKVLSCMKELEEE
jgi:hypothetical protein